MTRFRPSITVFGTMLLLSSVFGAVSAHAGAERPQWVRLDVGIVETARPDGVSPEKSRERARLSAARIRSSVLYRDGEFSTFWHRSPRPAGSRYETVQQTASLDRRVEDEWIALDKAKHVAFSFLWTLGTQYTAVNKGGISEHRALPISVTSSALIGVTKEVYDLRVGPTQYFSVRDLVADAVGIAFGIGLILL